MQVIDALPEIVPGILEAAPAFEPAWRALEEHRRDSGGVSDYLAMAELAHFVVDCAASGRQGELAPLFAVMEDILRKGDHSTRTLVTIGFLECVQNVSGHHPTVRPEQFVPLLGPSSAEEWEALNRFWAGKS